VPWVIGKKVQQNEAGLTLPNHEAVLRVLVGSGTEGTVLICWLLKLLEVNQSMWGPETLEPVLHWREVLKKV